MLSYFLLGKDMVNANPVIMAESSQSTSHKEACLLGHQKRQGFQVYPCQDCPKIFATKTYLTNHIRRYHDRKQIFVCHKCSKIYKNKKHLIRHNNVHKDNVYLCLKCGKIFNAKDNLCKHMKSHENNGKVNCDKCGKLLKNKYSLKQRQRIHVNVEYACQKCGRNFSRKSNRDRHHQICKASMKSALSSSSSEIGHTPHSSGSSRKELNKTYNCHICNIVCKNKSMLVRHVGRSHPVQSGSGRNLDESLWTDHNGRVNEPLRQLYANHMHEILLPHYLGEVHADFNFPLPNGQVTYNEMRDHLLHIFQELNVTFKVNISFGIILKSTTNKNKYRYYHPMETDRLMKTPFVISKKEDIDKLMNLLHSIDLLENMIRQRKNTKWVFHQVANVVYYVNKMNFPLGTDTEVKLPEYLLHNKSIHPLVYNINTRKGYNDHLCLFRCLALHKQHNLRGLERPCKQYLKQWLLHQKMKVKDFKGVQLQDLSSFEQCIEKT